MEPTALPGHIVDLITEGVELRDDRRGVVIAVRSVMLSAHRRGVAFADVHALLTDQRRRRLARQLAHGYGDRPIPLAQREEFLRQKWEETGAVVESTPALTRDVAVAFIDHVRGLILGADIPPPERSVLGAVLDAGTRLGTTRPAVPAREVGDATGLGRSRSHRMLLALCETEWLSLARRGRASPDPKLRRSNLYSIAPSHLQTYMGASPPVSQIAAVPLSHPPMSQEHPAVTLRVPPEHADQVRRLLAVLDSGVPLAGVSLVDALITGQATNPAAPARSADRPEQEITP